MSYPKTYLAVTPSADAGVRAKIFEPALRHFTCAFRAGDPDFADDAARDLWYAARRRVTDHVLRIVAGSRWSENLVLRGSLVLKAWLGNAAREPGDIDWIFRPFDVKIDSPMARLLLDDLIRLVSAEPMVGDALILTEKIASDDIWTYERADGKRVVVPWQMGDGPVGVVQMDIVFGEDLFGAPVQTAISSPDDNRFNLWSADKEVSLAWKLLWLAADSYPQGKDLYDATLLAEQASLSLGLLTRVLDSAREWSDVREWTPQSALELSVDWEEFIAEYPWIEGTEEDWKNRLAVALLPMFE